MAIFDNNPETTDDKWYFDSSTGEITKGYEGDWANRMGPYASKEEAQDALGLTQLRNDQADAWDSDDEDNQ